MYTLSPLFRLLALLILTHSVGHELFAQHALRGTWSDKFGVPGLFFADSSTASAYSFRARNTIRGVIPLGGIYGNDYLVYGRFNYPGNGIARRNTTTNTFERFTSGFEGEVFSAARKGDTLFVAIAFPYKDLGSKYSIKGIRISRQEIFDIGVQGISLNSYGSFTLETLCVHNDTLYGGGYPWSENGQNPTLWRWNGAVWQHDSTSAMTVRGSITTLTSFKGKLYAQGFISSGGGDTTKRNMIVWDGTTWQQVFTSTNFTTANQTLSIVGSDSSFLYVAGLFNGFQPSNGAFTAAKNLSYYDGNRWFAPTDTLASVQGLLLPAHCTSRNDSIFVCGRIDTIGGVAMNNVAVYDTRTKRWGNIGSGIVRKEGFSSLPRKIHPTGVELHVFGDFIQVGSMTANGFARFGLSSGQLLPIMGKNTAGIIDVSTSYNIFPYNNTLGIFGDVRFNGSGTMQFMSSYSGQTGWTPIAGGLSDLGITLFLGNGPYFSNYPGVRYFNAIQDGDITYIGGRFDHISFTTKHAIARIEPSGKITDLDSGVRVSRLVSLLSQGNTTYPQVYDMKKFGSSLYVAGDFYWAGNDTVGGHTASTKSIAGGIAAWNGTEWHRFGLGLNKRNPKNIYDAPMGYALASLPDGSVLVSGDFDLFDTIRCRNLVRLTPTGSIEPFGFAPNDTLSRSCKVFTFGDTVIVTGRFTTIGGKNIAGIAMFDGNEWKPFGKEDLSGTVIYDIVSHGDYLYFCGQFDSISTAKSSGIAAWNRITQEWHSVGKGVGFIPSGDSLPRGKNRMVTGMVVIHDTIYLAGDFDYADGKPSHGIAAWIPEKTVSVEERLPLAGNTLLISPNPAGDVLTITCALPAPEVVTIDVVNVFGQPIMTITHNALIHRAHFPSVSTSFLAQGVYYVRVQGTSTYVIQAVNILR